MNAKGKQGEDGPSNRHSQGQVYQTELERLERQQLSIADSQRVWSNIMERKQDATLNILKELAAHRPISLKTQIPPPAAFHLYSNEVEERIAKLRDESEEDGMQVLAQESDDDEANVVHIECDSEEENIPQEPRGVVKRGRGRPRKYRGRAGSSGAR